MSMTSNDADVKIHDCVVGGFFTSSIKKRREQLWQTQMNRLQVKYLQQ